MDIKPNKMLDHINILQQKFIDKKKKLSKFLNCTKIFENKSINKYVEDYLLSLEHNSQDTNMHDIYTYYIGGGYSWNELEYKFINHNQDENFDVSKIIGILEIVYIYNNFQELFNKIKTIYQNLFIPLQTFLLTKNISTNIAFENIKIENGELKREFQKHRLFKPSHYKIKLVVNNDDMMIAGSKSKRKRILKPNERILPKLIGRRQKGKGILSKYKLLENLLIEIHKESECPNITISEFVSQYNTYSILEFDFEYYHFSDLFQAQSFVNYFHDALITKNGNPIQNYLI